MAVSIVFSLVSIRISHNTQHKRQLKGVFVCTYIYIYIYMYAIYMYIYVCGYRDILMYIHMHAYMCVDI